MRSYQSDTQASAGRSQKFDELNGIHIFRRPQKIRGIKTGMYGKVDIPIDNDYPFKVCGELGKVTRLRGQLNTVDPWNLNQTILAEGKNNE